MTEPSVLRLSIFVTFALAVFGVVFGLLTGSASIIFDGVYTLIDAIMTSFALLVAKLIAFSHNDVGRARLTRNFTMGFWHLEPIVLGLSGTLLVGTAGYGLIMAVGSLMGGGRHLDFDLALIFALVALVSAVGMIVYDRRANKRLQSSFIALDVKAWTISAAMTGALLLAFLTGWIIRGTALEWLSPYIDPAVLALVCLIVLPLPLPTIRDALADVLLVTPPEMKKRVDDVASDAVQRHGFLSYRAYVARVGRGRQIEIYFIVPPGLPPRSLEAWDLIRDEIGEEVGGTGPDRWLTIAFAVNKEWAE